MILQERVLLQKLWIKCDVHSIILFQYNLINKGITIIELHNAGINNVSFIQKVSFSTHFLYFITE